MPSAECFSSLEKMPNGHAILLRTRVLNGGSSGKSDQAGLDLSRLARLRPSGGGRLTHLAQLCDIV